VPEPPASTVIIVITTHHIPPPPPTSPSKTRLTPHTPDLRGRFDVLSPAPPRSWLLDLRAVADRPVVELPQMGQEAGPVDFSLVSECGSGVRVWKGVHRWMASPFVGMVGRLID
jgi:hypothetical protein